MNDSEQSALLEGLLHAYSPSGNEAGAVSYFAEQLHSLGFQVEIDQAGNVTGSLGSGPREIVLLGHIDTVPGEIPVRREGDRLYGRGSVDAKGPLACFAAAAALAGALPGWRVSVTGAVGEESDSRGAKYLRERRPPDMCIIGEPSGWSGLTLGYKGSAWLEYQAQRSISHSASLSGTACEDAVQFWNGVQAAAGQYNQGRQRVFEQLTTSLRGMQSEQDGFTETARLTLNLRLPPDLTVAALLDLLSPAAGSGSLTLLDGIACYRAEKNTPLVRAFLAAIRAEGGKPGFLVKSGTSDMNIVGPAWGCPILAYGPGDSSLDHTPDEHILISEYLTAVRVLTRTLTGLQKAA